MTKDCFECSPESNFSRLDLRTISDLRQAMKEHESLEGWTAQGIDVTGIDFSHVDVRGMFLLGCEYESDKQKLELIERGAFVFPKLSGLTYNPYRGCLYTTHELLQGWSEGGYKATKDFEIYCQFDKYSDDSRRAPVHIELSQRIHDHAIDDALASFIAKHAGLGVVGIMGGHAARRDSPHYRMVAQITWELKRKGYLIASGGGPGIMEAANLGAYFAPYANPEVLDEAIQMVVDVPTFAHARSDTIDNYISSAMSVVERFYEPTEEDAQKYLFDSEQCRRSLAVPTWFYGHEPTNLFSDYIAKYFANSIREDGLLAICTAGVIYAPGGAGTLQEVFIDLSQNHYAMGNKRSPMVFLTEAAFGTTHKLIKEFIKKNNKTECYGDMITLVESAEEAVKFIEENPVRIVPKTT